MKHKLRIDGKVVAKTEGGGVVLAVISKLLAQSNQHS